MNKKFNYTIIKSKKRKTISIEVKQDASVVVRAPYRVSKNYIEVFVDSKEQWVLDTIFRVKQQNKNNVSINKLSKEDILKCANEALITIPEIVKNYSEIIGVTYGRVTIRNQRTRWGSCSAKGNLNFNCLLMLAPKEIQEYVVVHELCHRLEMNHSKAFWRQVESVLPDYKARKMWLKENGGAIISRMSR